jgi:pyridinium-3,5-biscarboxylic acid mononucleotide synthase
MEKTDIIKLLEQFKEGKIDQEEIVKKLSSEFIDDLGFAMIDTSRFKRTGVPEVIYASEKTVEQVTIIAERMMQRGIPILATRATAEMYESVKERIPGAIYYSLAKAIVYQPIDVIKTESYIAIVSAGTSDMPVAEEAAVTAEFLGNKVERVYDAGVAGIHRLFSKIDIIRGAKVVIVVAGLEGALASVVGGLINKPIIGVPTSIGYGASFGGLSALLSMLNSCANGVSVVNINNGFGAACQANLINKL